MLLGGSRRNHSATAGKVLVHCPVCDLRLWSCSSPVLRPKHTQANMLSRESSKFVHSTYCTKAYASDLNEFVGTMRNKSGTCAAQNLHGNWYVADSKTKMFLNDFLASGSTAPGISSSYLGYVGALMVQWLSLLWSLSSGTRLPRTYPGLKNYKWIWCVVVKRAIRLHLLKVGRVPRNNCFQ